VADLLGDDRKSLVVLRARAVTVGVQLGLVNLGSDHGDVH